MDYITHVDCIGILFVFSGSIIRYLLFNLPTSFSLLFLHNNFLNSFSSALKFLSVIPLLIKSYFTRVVISLLLYGRTRILLSYECE